MADFNVGDAVETISGTKGRILYGPFTTGRGNTYLMERADGTAFTVASVNLRALPAFAVGETATERAMGRAVEVVAGPFTGAANQDRYVIKRSNGVHSFVGVGTLEKRPVARAQEALRRTMEDTDTAFQGGYLFKGRTYDLGAEYTDRQGDVWKFNGDRAGDGMPLMDAVHLETFKGYRLDDIVTSYGPLHRS
ncbi:phiSA1p31-related protein [Streptomyces sp. NPDC000851]